MFLSSNYKVSLDERVTRHQLTLVFSDGPGDNPVDGIVVSEMNPSLGLRRKFESYIGV